MAWCDWAEAVRATARLFVAPGKRIHLLGWPAKTPMKRKARWPPMVRAGQVSRAEPHNTSSASTDGSCAQRIRST
eukprot:10020873-Alexandrium_andersonii.AAC.1